jgi:chromosomal replication initiator protein
LHNLLSTDFEVVVLCGDDELNNYTLEKTNMKGNISEDYRFDNFVVGPSNRFAHAAATAVSKNPASSYNPLFIYGPSGLGKTHLLYAIASEIKKKIPDYKIVYIKGDDFTNELIAALQKSAVPEFRNKYRMADLLLVDDIQFIAGKVSTQEEFFHTFNTLHEAKKQIVLTSDRPPHEISTLEDRLKTRFIWGLLADIQPPDYETRMAILKHKAYLDGINMHEDVMEYVATHITSNVRELEGAMISLLAQATLNKREITPDLARELIDKLIKNTKRELSIDYIQKVVCSYFNVPVEMLQSNTRKREIVQARQIAMYFSKNLTKSSLATIGSMIGDKDHATVLHACKTVTNLQETDKRFRLQLDEIEKRLKI